MSCHGRNPPADGAVLHNLTGLDVSNRGCFVTYRVDLATGERQWKKGRYGNGQVLLLPEADQLLVISEDGELVLLRANPDTLFNGQLQASAFSSENRTGLMAKILLSNSPIRSYEDSP